MLIAVNRYIIVCLPLKAAQWCTVSKVKIQLAFVLIAAVLHNIPKFAEETIVYHVEHTSNNGTATTVGTIFTKFGKMRLFFFVYDSIFLLIFLLVLPILTLTVLTIRLIKAMKAHRRMQLEMQSRSQRNESSVTFSLVIVVIVFIACQVPTFVWYALYEVLPYEANHCGGVLFYPGGIIDMLVTFNSSVNFVIYIIANKAFRDVLLENVCGRHPERSVDTAHEMTGANTN